MTAAARVAFLVFAGLLSACEFMGLRAADYHPVIDPKDFGTTIDNPYYPLPPGTTYEYRETAQHETTTNTIEVERETKTIAGVECRLVLDSVSRKGVVFEETEDCIAQSSRGDVWYFGADSREISAAGAVDTSGTWRAGDAGGEPGILMPGHPAPGMRYRQNYRIGVAEDMAQIVALGETVTVPAGTFPDCVRTEEWSLLEPGTDKKWYARGVGLVRTESTAGEVSVLVAIHSD